MKVKLSQGQDLEEHLPSQKIWAEEKEEPGEGVRSRKIIIR